MYLNLNAKDVSNLSVQILSWEINRIIVQCIFTRLVRPKPTQLKVSLISLNSNEGEVTCLMRFPSSHPGSPALGLRSTNAFPGGTQSSKLQICVCHIMSTTF